MTIDPPRTYNGVIHIGRQPTVFTKCDCWFCKYLPSGHPIIKEIDHGPFTRPAAGPPGHDQQGKALPVGYRKSMLKKGRGGCPGRGAGVQHMSLQSLNFWGKGNTGQEG